MSVKASTLKTLPSSPALPFGRTQLGLSLDKCGVEVLGNAARVELGKESCTIVGAGDTAAEVAARVKQINRLVEVTAADYEKEKLNERAARLSTVLPSSKSVLKPKLSLRKRSFVLRMP